MIALNNGWLVARFGARGGSVIIRPHAGSADGGRPLPPKNPHHLARPQPAALRRPPCRNPGRGSTLIIPRCVAYGGATAPLAVALPPGGEDSARNSSTWLRCSRWVFWRRGCASEALSLITLRAGRLCWEGCFDWLANTASHGKEVWCSAAAPVRGRLKETGVMFGVGAKEDKFRKNGKKELKVEVWQLSGWRFCPNLSTLCPQQDSVCGNSKHETTAFTIWE